MSEFNPTLLMVKQEEALLKLEQNYLTSLFFHYDNLKVSRSDILNFLHKAQLTGADPRRDEIYLIPRKVKEIVNGREEWKTVGTIVYSYHFIERKAQMTGQYEGMNRKTGVAEYFNPEKNNIEKQLMCEATVYRNGKPYSFTAWWPEYVQKKFGGELVALWKNRPHAQLEKCALAGALRSAFPEYLTGVYSNDEMKLAEDEQDQVFEVEKYEVQAKEETKKIEEIKEKISSTDLIELRVERIKNLLGVLTFGLNKDTKAKALYTYCGVNNFNDVKTKKADDLDKIISHLEADSEHKRKKTEKPSFKLDLNE